MTALDWRGVAAEGRDDLDVATTVRLRARSRALLRSLLLPHKRRLWWAVALLLVSNFAAMAGPYLVAVGIDKGIGDDRLLTEVVIALVIAAVTEYGSKRAFLLLSGKIGQGVLLDLRTRVYDKFQTLSVAFHEKYTSGRVISRLTSDVDAIGELLDGGLDDLVIAALSVLSVGVILLTLDLPMGLVTLLSFPLLLWISRWFRRESALAYRRTRECVALVIVQFVESLGGIRAVQAFRREPRNDEIFGQLNEDYRVANDRAFKLVALFAPGIKLIGNATIAAVLVFGAVRVIDGHTEVGVLAAFLLYL
ncbi:MAG: ATP-binding cassette, subfamily bacterial, partial [Frankiales bacterium]|nr:ATP-binding cassette, subfamily bacterial [Frankiales bacterium]